MIIKTRSILDSEVSVLVDFGKIEISSSLRAGHSSTIRRNIHTELFQIGDGGYYSVETLNIVSVQFLYPIPESVASFICPNII